MSLGCVAGQYVKKLDEVSKTVSVLDMFKTEEVNRVSIENNGDKITVIYNDGSREICNISNDGYVLEQYDTKGELINKLSASTNSNGVIEITKIK